MSVSKSKWAYVSLDTVLCHFEDQALQVIAMDVLANKRIEKNNMCTKISKN